MSRCKVCGAKEVLFIPPLRKRVATVTLVGLAPLSLGRLERVELQHGRDGVWRPRRARRSFHYA
jgi:hypothetical protein